MVKPKNSFEAMAREAARRLDEAHAANEQLSLLPEAVDPDQEDAGKVGRSKGKATNQMREWLASKGYRMPEEQLAQMAGLASSQDAVLEAMQKTELVLAWAYDGQKDKDDKPVTPNGPQRLAAFQQIYTAMLRASDALLPYGLAKATPDVTVQQAVQIVVPSAPAPAGQPRDVTPQPARISGRMVPADVAAEIEQKQALGNGATASEPVDIRTDGAND